MPWSASPTCRPTRGSTNCGASRVPTGLMRPVLGHSPWAIRRSWWPSSTRASTSTIPTSRPTSGPTPAKLPTTASTTTGTATSTTFMDGTSSTTTLIRTMTTTTAPTWPARSPGWPTTSAWSAWPPGCGSWPSSSCRLRAAGIPPMRYRRCRTRSRMAPRFRTTRGAEAVPAGRCPGCSTRLPPPTTSSWQQRATTVRTTTPLRPTRRPTPRTSC